uniref:U296u n=1 Tax=Mycobacterium leprae TaxID=1769 RepID=Q50168_MYCLR|nr:u296u [Mycobacterium leprae]
MFNLATIRQRVQSFTVVEHLGPTTWLPTWPEWRQKSCGSRALLSCVCGGELFGWFHRWWVKWLFLRFMTGRYVR